MSDVPEELQYTENHEWIDPDSGWMGITDHAQQELGDIVFLDLPDEGKTVSAGENFMIVESVKSVSDIYAPADGTVESVNENLRDTPELVNDAPYGDGRIVRIDVDQLSDDLMSSSEYEDYTG